MNADDKGYIIVAELREDQSDMMSDYWGSRVVRTVLLAESKHGRDMFSEMRKAAATFEPTRHLGPGCDVWRPRVVLECDFQSGGRYYHAGQYSPWHSECDGPVSYDGLEFTTESEAWSWIAKRPAPGPMEGSEGQRVTFKWETYRDKIEHREKYSMGGGYYLKAGSRHNSGWSVRKVQKGWHDAALERAPKVAVFQEVQS